MSDFRSIIHLTKQRRYLMPNLFRIRNEKRNLHCDVKNGRDYIKEYRFLSHKIKNDHFRPCLYVGLKNKIKAIFFNDPSLRM
jgi:hypothetical protein